MSILMFSGPFFRRLLLLLAALNVVGFAGAAAFGWLRASLENGVVENMQLLILIVSMVAGIVAACRSGGFLRAVFACWAAVMLLMVQREFDFTVLGTDSLLYRLRGTDVRLAFWIPVLVLLAVWILRYRRELLRSLPAVRWPHVWPILMIGVLMLCSNLAENATKSGAAAGMSSFLVFMEELLELNAYGVIAAMGLAFAARAGRPATPEEIEARNRLDPAG